MYQNQYDKQKPQTRPESAQQPEAIREIPLAAYTPIGKKTSDSFTSSAKSFLESIVAGEVPASDDPFAQKLELGSDKIRLMFAMIEDQERVKYDNLSRLYVNLFELDRMQKERPFPDNYLHDALWFRLNERKLKVYDEIRREEREHMKSLSFMGKELLQALLDQKRQKQKESLLSNCEAGDPEEND